MLKNKEELNLGIMIKSLLKEQSLSMRKLSLLTGIDTSTISRIVNGKQPPNINHLQKISQHLNVPIEKLLVAAGYDIGVLDKQISLNNNTVADIIQQITKYLDISDQECLIECVEKDLNKYEQYALTEEGKEMIYKNFDEKINNVNGVGPFIQQLKEMYEQFCNDSISAKERAILGSGLFYFILSTDIIPDYIFPYGYFDDVIAIKLVIDRLSKIDNNEID
ncbi:helix-turn-helix domain-containing protein [Clostridium amazonitimonense]|uniref:helix-turn-helix domain-containing protein n=1 Tax=Clostridium amazonitimonense TaxID=1499689 RepID=UPI000509F79F|nr:helix-turn-helix domain-containing protein [Clostridium amazonitimonense]